MAIKHVVTLGFGMGDIAFVPTLGFTAGAAVPPAPAAPSRVVRLGGGPFKLKKPPPTLDVVAAGGTDIPAVTGAGVGHTRTLGKGLATSSPVAAAGAGRVRVTRVKGAGAAAAPGHAAAGLVRLACRCGGGWEHGVAASGGVRVNNLPAAVLALAARVDEAEAMAVLGL